MHRILFHTGSLPIYSYGFMVAIGFVVAILVGVRYGKSRGFATDQVIKLENLIFITGIIGSRLLYVVTHPGKYYNNPLDIMNLTSGGLAWHGAIIASIFSMYYFSRKEKFPFWDVGDLAMLCGIVGLSFGRIGCFLHGCCYGKPATVFWAVVFPGVDNIPRHPAQLYEVFLDFIVFIILLQIWKKRNFSGEVFCCFLGFYSVVRFFTEFFRDTAPPFLLISLTLMYLS